MIATRGSCQGLLDSCTNEQRSSLSVGMSYANERHVNTSLHKDCVREHVTPTALGFIMPASCYKHCTPTAFSFSEMPTELINPNELLQILQQFSAQRKHEI